MQENRVSKRGCVVGTVELAKGLNGTVALSSYGDNYVFRVYGLDWEFAYIDGAVGAV